MVKFFLVWALLVWETFLFAQKTVEELRDLLRQGLYVDAINEAKSMLRNKPDDPDLLAFLVEYYLYFVEDLDVSSQYLAQLKKILPNKGFIEQFAYAYRIPYYEHQILLQGNDYQTALNLLEQIELEKIFVPTWFYHTKSWNLFKLSKIDEAIQSAEKGLSVGEDPISNLNMLGILYSTNQKYEESIKYFEKAIEIGRFLKTEHQAVVNNLAEVYEELFKEQKAIDLYEEVIKEDASCEAFLTFINLAFLYLDFLEVRLARRTLDRYRQCVSRFPYKSPKAYLPLINLVESRAKLIEGDFDGARRLLRTVLDYDQWLGRIGTDMSDLRLSAFQTFYLATQGKQAKDYFLATDLWEKFIVILNNLWLRKESWFANREFLKLALSLNNFEDLRIKYSDSFLFYPFLGEQLKNLPKNSIRQKIMLLAKNNKAPHADLYYTLYLAYLDGVNNSDLKNNYFKLRSWYDEALNVAYLNMMSELETERALKASYETLMYEKLPSSFFLFDKKLPVELDCKLSFWKKWMVFYTSPFYQVAPNLARFKLTLDSEGNSYKFIFSDKQAKLKSIIVRDAQLFRGFRTLIEKVFQ